MPDETATILLNGNSYVVKLPIRHYDVPVQTEPFRTTGAFLRSNNPKLEPYAFNDWHKGFGTRLVRPGHPEDQKGFFDATVLTMWKQGITAPITEAEVTDIADKFITCSALYNGSLWAIWSPTATTIGVTLVARTAAATWTGGGTVFTDTTANGVVALDLIAADKLYCLLNNDVGSPFDHVVRYSLDGVTWTAPATTPITIDLIASAQNKNLDNGRLAFDGTRIIAVIWDSVNSIVKTFSSTNGGDTWAETTGCRFSSSSGVTGAVAYLDTDDTINIYVATANGLKMVDIAAATQTTILDFNGNTHNGRRMTTHNGSLYVPIDNGANAPFGMKKITISNGGRIIEDVGLDITQGIPADMLGNVRWMRSSGPFLFAAVGGNGASRNARIICTSGLPGEGWQMVNQHSTANDIYPWVDVIGADMYLQRGGAVITDPGDTIRLLNLLAPPNSGVTFSYQTAAILELPEFGGDAPSEDGAFFQVQAEASGLVDAAEVIIHRYGVNGASASTTTGPTINGTNRRGNLGTSNRGVSARTLRQSLRFDRGGDTALTVLLREFVLLFRKNPAHLHGWEFEIDVEATRQLDRGESSIYDELETINHLDTLVPFVEYQALGEVQVEMVNFERMDWIRGGELNRQNARVEGTIKIRLEEVLAHT